MQFQDGLGVVDFLSEFDLEVMWNGNKHHYIRLKIKFACKANTKAP